MTKRHSYYGFTLHFWLRRTALTIECCTPIWWLPRYIKTDKGRRMGWLLFGLGVLRIEGGGQE